MPTVNNSKKNAQQSRAGHTAKNRRNTVGLRPWEKGQSGNPKGRPAGVPNKATGEAKEFFVQLVNDPLYREKFRDAFVNRRLKPQIEVLVWHYAAGRPRVTVETDAAGTLADMLDRMAAESGL